MLVSILIPAYNAEKFIAESITSALAQDWVQKEIIIVDDGSTDYTTCIAKTFESKYVKIIMQENRGASAARNAALYYAQGDYIQWLDADDILAPDKISQQLKGGDPGLSSRTLLTSSWGKFFSCPQRAIFRPDALWQDLTPLDWIFKKFTENLWMNPATWLVSRQLTELAGPWDERLSLDDDGEYMCRLVARSEKIKFISDAKCYYRMGNVSSLSSKISDKALNSQFLSLNLCIEHLLSLEDSERTRRACVQYLQDSFAHFYPEKVEIVNKSRDLARSLGGELAPPAERFHFLIFRKLFGWKSAKLVRQKYNEAKLFILRNLDKLASN